MSDDKRENSVSGSSEPEEVDSGSEVPAATIPKKRGRPAKGEKVVKIPSGRGRGRPKAGVEIDAEAVENGKKEPGSRGRPPKAAGKKLNIQPSGKGRGRPKGPIKRVAEEESEEEEEEEEQVHEEVEKKKLGRPCTGAVNLDIKRTGKGQGRPSNAKLARLAQRDADEASGKVIKYRGRPSGKAASNAKAAAVEELENEPEEEEEEEEVEEEDEDDHDESNGSIAEVEENTKKPADTPRTKLAAA